jgi:hypothetical protein
VLGSAALFSNQFAVLLAPKSNVAARQAPTPFTAGDLERPNVDTMDVKPKLEKLGSN